MENENDLEKVDEVPEIVETYDESETDTTDWKSIALQNHGIAKRLRTKLEKAKTPTPETPKPAEPEKKGFDYAEKAYLKTSGITPDEFAFVEEVMKSTGKSLDEVLEAKYFQAELKEKRELAESKAAVPAGTKRGTSPARDSVDYWLAKGEFPPADQFDLRVAVNNARIAKEQRKTQFTDNPVAKQ